MTEQDDAAQKQRMMRAFIIAVERYEVVTATDFLARGIDIAEADAQMANGASSLHGKGFTTLGWAAYSGYERMAELLVGAGADIDLQDKWGNTPLMWAVESFRPEMIRFLVSAGASFDKSNAGDKTVFDLAKGREIDPILRAAIAAHPYAVQERQAAKESAERAVKTNAMHATAVRKRKVLNARAPTVTIRPAS